jgi:hypothetical protein
MTMYYSDSLKAAWMSREFGVIFTDDLENLITFGISNGCLTWYRQGVEYTDDIYFIHFDSLPVFEPKEGDNDENGAVFTKTPNYYMPQYKNGYWSNDHRVYENSTIDKRENKTFFTPEVVK